MSVPGDLLFVSLPCRYGSDHSLCNNLLSDVLARLPIERHCLQIFRCLIDSALPSPCMSRCKPQTNSLLAPSCLTTILSEGACGSNHSIDP